MANYYHEARAQVRNYKKMTEDNKRRAERRAELANARADLPVHLITVDGRGCPIHRNTEQHEDIERMSGMMAWNGDPDCMIDRFDVRAMLDFYREYERPQHDSKTDDEKELDERLAFESFRDLVKLVRKGLYDEAGLAYVEDEALDIRVQARSKASAAAGVAIGTDLPERSIAPGEGAYAAAGFSYGGDEGGGIEGDDGDDDYDGVDVGDAAEDDMIEAAEDDEDALNRLGEECGIRHFTAQLQRAVVQEEEELEQSFKKRKRMSRRKMTERVRRMLGQGLNPFGKSREWWKTGAAADAIRAAAKPRTRGSPDYGDAARDGAGGRPRGAGRPSRRRDEPEFLTEFTSSRVDADDDDSSDESPPPGPGRQASGGARGDAGVHEAMPGRVDPATAGGPVALPAEGSRMYGRREYTPADREAVRLKEAERDRIKMNRVTVKAGGGKETPQERLKRLMAAQFNSNVAKDTKKILDRKAQEERDRQARVTIERHAAASLRAQVPPSGRAYDRRSASPGRRSRSRSPPPAARERDRDAARPRHDSRSPRRERERERSRSPPRRRRSRSPLRRPSRSPQRRYSRSRSPDRRGSPRRRPRSPPRRRSPDRHAYSSSYR